MLPQNSASFDLKNGVEWNFKKIHIFIESRTLEVDL